MIDVSYTEPAPKKAVDEFPYLAKSNSLVLLVTDTGKYHDYLKGVILVGNGIFPTGMYSETWNKGEFKRFDGPVTIKNKVAF